MLVFIFSRDLPQAAKPLSQSHTITDETVEILETVEEITSVIRPEALPAEEADEVNLARVTRVIDGDTFEAVSSGDTLTVRLIGIDAPEINKKECFADEAKELLRQLLEGKTVRLESDSTQREFDRYDRRLAYVWLGEELINARLIEEGYAYEFTYFYPYLRQEKFQSLELIARSTGRGLWAPETCGGKRRN